MGTSPARRPPAGRPRRGICRRTDLAPVMAPLKLTSRRGRTTSAGRQQPSGRIVSVQSHLATPATSLAGFRIDYPCWPVPERRVRDSLMPGQGPHEDRYQAGRLACGTELQETGTNPAPAKTRSRVRSSGCGSRAASVHGGANPARAVKRALESDWFCIGPADVSGSSLLQRAQHMFWEARHHSHENAHMACTSVPSETRISRSACEKRSMRNQLASSAEERGARSVIIWWLFAAAAEMQFRRETAGLAVHFFDCIRGNVTLSAWLEHAASCLLIAGKVQERYPIKDESASVVRVLEWLLRKTSTTSPHPERTGWQLKSLSQSLHLEQDTGDLSGVPSTSDRSSSMPGNCPGVAAPAHQRTSRIEQLKSFQAKLLCFEPAAWRSFSTITPLRQGSWRSPITSKLPCQLQALPGRKPESSDAEQAGAVSTESDSQAIWRRIRSIEPQVLDWLHWELQCPTIYSCLYLLYRLYQDTNDQLWNEQNRYYSRVEEATTPVRARCLTGAIRSSTTDPAIENPAQPTSTRLPAQLIEASLSPRTENMEIPEQESPHACFTPVRSGTWPAPDQLLALAESYADHCLQDLSILQFSSDVIASACLIEALGERGYDERRRYVALLAQQQLSVGAEALRSCCKQLREKLPCCRAVPCTPCPETLVSHVHPTQCSPSVVAGPQSHQMPARRGSGSVSNLSSHSLECPEAAFTPICRVMYEPMRQRWDNLLFPESLLETAGCGPFAQKTSNDISPVDISQGRF